MGNPFLWEQARRIDNTLQGDDWPRHMTPAQIAHLHFHADEGHRKTLLALLYKKADFGGIKFDDVTETYVWHGSPVSIGYATQPSLAANAIRDMYRETRDKQLNTQAGMNVVTIRTSQRDFYRFCCRYQDSFIYLPCTVW